MAIPKVLDICKEIEDFKTCTKKEEDIFIAVVGAGLLDKFLAAILGQFFITGSSTCTEVLFDNNKSWDMATKAKVAYCTGQISKSSYTNCMAICSVRNQFAHSHLFAKFRDPKIEKICKGQLDLTGTIPIDYNKPPGPDNEYPVERLVVHPRGQRERFTAALIATLRRIVAQSMKVKHQQTLD